VARVLRWTFHRDDESVLCELGLCPDDSAYELRIDPPWNPTGARIELFDDAMSAFERQATVERLLIGEGWSLVRFVADDVGRW
jgi:hypothetical protein